MREFALKFIVLWGWKRLFVGVLAGLVCAVATPPLYVLPGQIFGLCALVWLLDGVYVHAASRRARLWPAFFTGWAFGFGYFILGLFWISEAFLVEPDLFAWMIPFVLLLFPLALGIFYGVAAALAMMLWTSGLTRIIALAAAFTAAEWIRGNIFTGFPWNAIGYSAGILDGLLQFAAVSGVYGLTYLMVLLCAAPAILADESEQEAPLFSGTRIGLIAILVMGTLVWGIGSYRLATHHVAFDETVKLRLVQPNIPQNEKWKPENKDAIFQRYLSLSDKATSPERSGVTDITHLIWPESAVPFLLEEDKDAMAAIAGLVPENVTLITGAIHRPPGSSIENAPGAIYNSVLLIDGEGAILSRYSKFHLVPFGEYLPLSSILQPLGLRKLVVLPSGFISGPGPRTLSVPGAPSVSPLVCYEAIFSGQVTQVGKRPAWLLNVTNDAWFGDSFGPKQHFAQARLRTIEEGLPLVRAANTGISAVIDPLGRIVKKLPAGSVGVLDAYLPKPLQPTIFSRLRNLTCAILIFVSVLVCVVFGGLIKRRRE